MDVIHIRDPVIIVVRFDSRGFKLFTWMPIDVLHIHDIVIIDSSICGIVHDKKRQHGHGGVVRSWL